MNAYESSAAPAGAKGHSTIRQLVEERTSAELCSFSLPAGLLLAWPLQEATLHVTAMSVCLSSVVHGSPPPWKHDFWASQAI